MSKPEMSEMPVYVPNYFQPDQFHYFAETNWGSGKSRLEYPEISQLPSHLEMFILGHFAACPTITDVGDAYLPAAQAANWILNRYDSCNRGTRHLLLPIAEELNPDLHKQISVTIDRLPEEPVGKHDKGFVPPIHSAKITFMGTPVGYGGAREVYLLTRFTDLQAIRGSAEYMKAINRCVGDAGTPAELLVNLALSAIKFADADKFSALDHAVARGKIDEENNRKEYAKVVYEFIKKAPWVINFVNSLPTSDQDKAIFNKLFHELLGLI